MLHQFAARIAGLGQVFTANRGDHIAIVDARLGRRPTGTDGNHMRAILRGRIADLHAQLGAHGRPRDDDHALLTHVVAQLRRQFAHFARGGFQALLRFCQRALGLRL